MVISLEQALLEWLHHRRKIGANSENMLITDGAAVVRPLIQQACAYGRSVIMKTRRIRERGGGVASSTEPARRAWPFDEDASGAGDARGLDLEALEATGMAANRRVKLILSHSDFQNPDRTVDAAASRRKGLELRTRIRFGWGRSHYARPAFAARKRIPSRGSSTALANAEKKPRKRHTFRGRRSAATRRANVGTSNVSIPFGDTGALEVQRQEASSMEQDPSQGVQNELDAA